jgi:hypothetical protein
MAQGDNYKSDLKILGHDGFVSLFNERTPNTDSEGKAVT